MNAAILRMFNVPVDWVRPIAACFLLLDSWSNCPVQARTPSSGCVQPS